MSDGKVREAVAHVFPDDLRKLQTTECSVTAYSVEMMSPDRGDTVALCLGSQSQTDKPWTDLAAALYQACGAYDLPERILDILVLAASDEPFGHLVDELLPCCPEPESGSTMYVHGVPMPKTADQAELMAKAGIMWLEENAPDRLVQSSTPQQSEKPVGFTTECEGNQVGEGPVRAVLHPGAAFSLPPKTDLYAGPQPAAQVPEREWISCRDRTPCESDGDEWHKNVWYYTPGVHPEICVSTWAYVPRGATHWMPTGLQRPKPPRTE